jgi:hypothetical protein
VAVSSELGWSWRSRKRAAGEGSKAGEGKERRVESARAGGGPGEELERRWAALTAGGRAGEQRNRGAPEKEEREEGVRGNGLQNYKNPRGLLVNHNFP